ncbi:unnamed protein product, partial [Staurois parvus]
MQGPGRPDIVNAGSGETRYSDLMSGELLLSLHAVNTHYWITQSSFGHMVW